MAHHNLAFESCELDYNINLDDTEYYQMKMNPLSKIEKPTGNCLTFVDFCPEYRRKADSWFFQSQYETLRFKSFFKSILTNRFHAVIFLIKSIIGYRKTANGK